MKITSEIVGYFDDSLLDDFFAFRGEVWDYPHDLNNLIHCITLGDIKKAVEEIRKISLELLKQIDGAFHLVFFDSRVKRGFLYKSLLCKSSLYYRQEGKRLFFSSELKYLLDHKKSYLEQVDKEKILSACLGDQLPKQESYFKGIYRIPAGHIGYYENGQLKIYQIDYLRNDVYKEKSFQDYVCLAKEILQKTVNKRLSEQDKIAVILSGGMDSSSVLAQLKSMGREVYAIHWSFKRIPAADESNYANKVASFFKVPLFEIDTDEYMYLPKWNYFTPYNHGYFPFFEKAKEICKEKGIKILANGYLGDLIFGSLKTKVSLKSIFKNLRFDRALKYMYEALGTPYIKEDLPIHPRLHWFKNILSDESINKLKDSKPMIQNEKLNQKLISYSDREIYSIFESEYIKEGVTFFYLFASRELMELSLSLPEVYKVLPTGGQWVDKVLQRVIFLDCLPKECIIKNFKNVMNSFHEKYIYYNRDQIFSILSEDSYLNQWGVIDWIKLKNADLNQLLYSASALINCCMVELWLKGLEEKSMKNKGDEFYVTLQKERSY